MRLALSAILILLASLGVGAQTLTPDSVCEQNPAALPESVVLQESAPLEVQNRGWWYDLTHSNFDFANPNPAYPKFVKFCARVYQWADKTFNTYDPEYVDHTGKKWKAMIRNENWFDTYNYKFYAEDRKLRLDMMTEASINLGAYLQYMAVSVGYSLDMGNLVGHRPVNLKKFEFSFTCARFTADLYYTENFGGTTLRRVDPGNNLHAVNEFFPGMKQRSLGVDAYYFLNNKRYSQGAAYGFSKIQRKSAGSFMFGFSYFHRDLSFDFSQLPDDVLEEFGTKDADPLLFKTNTWSLLAGYGYNWVFARNFLFNVTTIPGIGVTHNLRGAYQGGKDRPTLIIKGRLGCTWNIHRFFLGLYGTINGSYYRDNHLAFFSAVVNGMLAGGIRF